MRSRFLIRGTALRAAASFRAARGKALVELARDALIAMRFPARRAQRGRPEAAPDEEARAHAQKLLIATIFAVFVVFAVFVSHLGCWPAFRTPAVVGQIRQEMARAIAKAAAAASPPMTMVWSALRNGLAPVNRPFTKPKTSRASRVTRTDMVRPEAACATKI
jgi:hypothetical protein